jgi:Ni,Fe-hydrogenase I small subunit
VRVRHQPGDGPADDDERGLTAWPKAQCSRRHVRVYGGIHAMAGNPTGAASPTTGWGWKSGGLPIVCVPGCPCTDNLSETILYLLYRRPARRR